MAYWSITWPTDGAVLILPEGRISNLNSAGPAARAGLQPGDIVLAIDDHPLANVSLYGDYQVGQQVTLTILRADRVRKVIVTLVPPEGLDLLFGLASVVVSTVFWGASMFVFALRPLSSVCQAFFLFSQASAMTLAVGQLAAVNVGWWGIFVFYLLLVALPPLLAHLHVTFTGSSSPLVRFAPHILTGLSTTLALLLIVDLVTSGNAHVPVWRYVVRAYPAVILLATTLGIVYTYLTTSSANLRRRIRALAFGTVAGFIPLVMFSLLPDILHRPDWQRVPYQVTFLFLAVIPITHAYAIVVHDLTPLDRLFNRSLVVFSLSVVWAGLYVGGVEVGLALATDSSLLPPLVGGLVTILMAVLFMPLKTRLQQAVDHLFYGGWYDYRSVVSRISSALPAAFTPEELASQLVGPLVQALRLQGGGLYLTDPAREDELVLQASTGLVLPEQLEKDQALIAWLTSHGSLAEAQTLPTDLSLSNIAGQDLSFLLLLRREGRVLGLLLLGARHADDFGEPIEREILMTLIGPATLAAHNIVLISDLRQALKDLETARDALREAHHQILVTREDERAQLSWNLHDGPVQDLIALGYRLFSNRLQARELSPELAQDIEAARQEANRLSIVLRNICTELRSEVLDLTGLGPEIRRHAYDTQQETGLHIEVDVPRHGPKLADPLGITLFRVYREAISNVLRHAQASHAWVHFHLDEEGAYELVVSDDGHGFNGPLNLDSLARAHHFGLFNARERMSAIDGQLSIHSQPGAGTEVRAWGKLERAKPASSPSTSRA